MVTSILEDTLTQLSHRFMRTTVWSLAMTPGTA